nr:hypothetical protein [uncultured Vibrio sp.]
MTYTNNLKTILISILFVFYSGSVVCAEQEQFVEEEPGLFSPECLKDKKQCFDHLIVSNFDDNSLKAIVLYLNNYDEISPHFKYEKLLEMLSDVSFTNDVAKRIESLIYYSGYHVPRDVDRAISITKSIDNFENNSYVLETLGKMYVVKYVEDKNKDETLPLKIKETLNSAQEMGSVTASRTLAYWLINYGDDKNLDELSLLGKTLKQLATSGNERDKLIYQSFVEEYGSILKDAKPKD